jgi:hypothetical protein
MAKRRDWDAIIEKLNTSKTGTVSINMGSPGSAQVTRCRLLEQWTNLRVRTRGAMLYIELAA